MDAKIVLKTKKSREEYPQRLNLIVAEVEVEGVTVDDRPAVLAKITRVQTYGPIN